jgi:hypothetical protein
MKPHEPWGAGRAAGYELDGNLLGLLTGHAQEQLEGGTS